MNKKERVEAEYNLIQEIRKAKQNIIKVKKEIKEKYERDIR